MGDAPPDVDIGRADKLFGQIAVQRHFVAPQHVREGLSELAKKSKRKKGLRLADVLIKRGYLTKGQAETIDGFVEKKLGPDRVGRYELIEKIGEGGMGTVFKARDGSSGRVVALKVLPPKLAEDKIFMGRFQREAIAVTRLDHPNIVRGLDVGTADDAHYIAMEFIDGVDCDKMLARRSRLPEREAANIAMQVAKALEYAGSRRLVHRDIKPANILVMRDGTAKLTDLGLAKSTSATATKLTQTGITMGTPHYISPEQAMGSSDLDVRSDIYSLGATLYQLVTGRVPFEGSSPAIIVAKHLTEELPNPRDLVAELSEGIVLVLEKMLAKKREDRYADPADLVRDLQKVIRGVTPHVEALEAGRSTIMKAAEFREAAERLAKKRRDRMGRRGPALVVLGILLGLGIAVTVVVLIIKSQDGMFEQIRDEVTNRLGGDGVAEDGSPPGPTAPAWTPLLDGKGLSGWRISGARGWAFRGDFIEGRDPGSGQIESPKAFGDYSLQAEVAASKGARAWIVLGKRPATERGGYRIPLPALGEDRWVRIAIRIDGGKVVAAADGAALGRARGSAAPEGVIAFAADRGTVRFRNVRVQLASVKSDAD
ncbi:MAG: protein kinase domain-containing protein [Planctomycetota bacterium]|jgi:serine/threonine-protein kinase